MAWTWENKSSFKFCGVDMWQTYGLQITDDGEAVDTLMPGLRSRKQTIPLRHGAYDYGACAYDERQVSLTVVTTKAITRDEAREMAYLLAKKGELRLWNEPERYYTGRVYTAPTLEQLRRVGNRFTLTFICEPFAYGTAATKSFTNLKLVPNYTGTATTPTYIVIENTSDEKSVTNIYITQLIKKE